MIRVLIAGLGNMGKSHALAHHRNAESQIVGLVNRSKPDLPAELNHYPLYESFENIFIHPADEISDSTVTLH